jgi:hypothetical protein
VTLTAAQKAMVEIQYGSRANLPDGTTPEDIAVLAHEMGHVAMTRPPSVLPQAIQQNPVADRIHTLLEEWRIDARLVAAGHDPDPRIGMDRFDWSQVPIDAARLSILDRALLWIQYAYVQTGAKNPTVGMRAAELWSLLDDPWRDALTHAYQDIVPQPANDALHDAWALALASLVPPSAPNPIIDAHITGMTLAGIPPLTDEAQKQDQDRTRDQRNAQTAERRAEYAQDRPDTSLADRNDKTAAQNADQKGQEEQNKKQGPQGRGVRAAQKAQKLGSDLEDDDGPDAQHPDAQDAQKAAQKQDQERADSLKPSKPYNKYSSPYDPQQEAAQNAQEAGRRAQESADQDGQQDSSPSMPSKSGNGPQRRPQPLTEPEKKARMGSGRETWHGQLVVHSHLSKDRESTKRVLDIDGPSEYGTRVLDITRMWTDQKIFDAGVRPGGTVIVDGSGSMGWSVETLEDLILACPGVTVGVYFKPHGRKPAQLCIVAKDGLRADDFLTTCYETASGGNDGSDVPALAWLAESIHKAPRVILSDGDYWTYPQSSPPGTTYVDYNDRCNNLMLLGRIVRVPTVPDLFAALTGQRAHISDGDRSYPTRLRALR